MGDESHKRRKRRRGEARGAEGADEKVVRDSFTMPRREHSRLKALKARCIERGVAVTKSELLRAGVRALDEMGDRDLLMLLERIDPVRTGRPPKGGRSQEVIDGSD